MDVLTSRACTDASAIKPLRPPTGMLKDRYRRLALVTHARHLTKVPADNKEVLVVFCDWLMWQRESAAGRDCVYYELGLIDDKDEDDLAHTLFLHANDWLFDLGEDPTMYRGVSLGKMMAANISMCLVSFHRIRRSLQGLISRFRPDAIDFYDFQNDINVLPRSIRLLSARIVAEANNIAFVDHFEDGTANDDGVAMSDRPKISEYRTPPGKALLLACYSFMIHLVSTMRAMLSSSSRSALLLVNTNVLSSLLNASLDVVSAKSLRPIVFCRTVPKDAALIVNCIKANVFLARAQSEALSKADVANVNDITDRLRTALESVSPADEALVVTFAYIREVLFDGGIFMTLAGVVNRANRDIAILKPDRIVVDGVRDAFHRAYVELAKNQGIPVDYIWHSPAVPQSLCMDALGGDDRVAAAVDRCLSWGRVNDAWLNNVGARQERVRVGSPFSARYGNAEKRLVPKRSARRNALLLQYTPVVTDLRGLNNAMFENIIKATRTLRGAGFSTIKLKLHPGPGRWKKAYFQAIVDHWELDIEVLKTEPLSECIAWADIVVGPIQSGSVYESLAGGKPYFAFLISPHGQDADYFKGYPLLEDAEMLPDALESWEWSAASELLDSMYDTASGMENPRRFWTALGGGLEPPEIR